MTTDDKREKQVIAVVREHFVDGTWGNPKAITREGKDMIDDEGWVYENVNSAITPLHEQFEVSLISRRHRLPTESTQRGFEYMMVDRREFEEVRESDEYEETSDLVSVIKRLYHLGAFYEPVVVDDDYVHAGDDIEKGGEVIHEGHGEGGNAVTGAELAKKIQGDDERECQKALSKLLEKNWVDRRKRYEDEYNPYEYWLNGLGYEEAQELASNDAMEW